MENYKNSFEIAEMINRYLKDELSLIEKEKLQKWIDEKPENKKLFDKIIDEENIKNKLKKYQNFNNKEAWDKIYNKTINTRKNTKIITLKILKYAAVILIPILIGGYIIYNQYLIINKNITEIPQIEPGSQKAILILENGQSVNLGNTGKKVINVTDKSSIVDTNNTLIYHEAKKIKKEIKTIYNTLQTPRGGEYNLILSDGTKIWINADSEIKYPVQFNDSARKIYLKGEAYFEVAENKSKPFILTTNNIEISVLGTSFNVMAYFNENNIKTTLVEGKIKIGNISENIQESKEIYLNPGHQAVLNRESQQFEVKKVDTEIYTAWKDGKFVFANETLEEIMTRLGRWYDFETEFTDAEIKYYHFSGTLKRYENISEILKMMELTTKIKFEFKENLILIKKIKK